MNHVLLRVVERQIGIVRDYEIIFDAKHKKEKENEKSSGGYACYDVSGVYFWM